MDREREAQRENNYVGEETKKSLEKEERSPYSLLEIALGKLRKKHLYRS